MVENAGATILCSLAFLRLQKRILLQVQFFVLLWEPLHARVTNHDVDCFLQSNKDILLNVRDTMLRANLTYHGS